MLILEEVRRGHRPLNGIPESVSDFLKLRSLVYGKKRSDSYYREMRSKIGILLGLIQVLRGTASPEVFLNEALQSKPDPPGFFTPLKGYIFLRRYLGQILQESLYTYLNGLTDSNYIAAERARQVRSTFRFKSCYANFRTPWESVANDIRVKLQDFTNRINKWTVPMALRVIALPNISTVFVGRTRDIMIMAQAKLAKDLFKILKEGTPITFASSDPH